MYHPNELEVFMLLKERDEDSIELTVSLSQLKSVYLALFRQLHAKTADAFDVFDEDDMLLTLQAYLQERAAAAGVDGTNHSEWDRFLGVNDAPSCETRFNDRREPQGGD
jgi:hypothetical protein